MQVANLLVTGTRWQVFCEWRWAGVAEPHHWETEFVTIRARNEDGKIVVVDDEGVQHPRVFASREVEVLSSETFRFVRNCRNTQQHRDFTITETWTLVGESPQEVGPLQPGDIYLMKETSYLLETPDRRPKPTFFHTEYVKVESVTNTTFKVVGMDGVSPIIKEFRFEDFSAHSNMLRRVAITDKHIKVVNLKRRR